jgi:hypothetical protein
MVRPVIPMTTALPQTPLRDVEPLDPRDEPWYRRDPEPWYGKILWTVIFVDA